MPQFAPSSVHVATPLFSNPKSAGFDYQATLCMGATLTEMASASFHLDAGQSKSVPFSVTMPTTLGTYPVYLKVSSGGVLIRTFVATEDVVIYQPVIILRPTCRGAAYSDVGPAYSGMSPQGAAYNYWCVREEVPDDDQSYVLGGWCLYPQLANMKIVVGGDVRVGGVLTLSANKNPTTAYALYSQQWTTRPSDNKAWTWNDIDKLQFGVCQPLLDWRGLICIDLYAFHPSLPLPSTMYSFTIHSVTVYARARRNDFGPLPPLGHSPPWPSDTQPMSGLYVTQVYVEVA